MSGLGLPSGTAQELLFWELTPQVCDLAALIAPNTPLRTLDTLHLATYFLARRKVEGLDNLTADIRLEETAKQA